MTLNELKDWIKSVKRIDSQSYWDSNGNEDSEIIYLKDGEYYRIEYCNGCPYGDYKNNNYSPQKVKMVKQMVEQIDWVVED